MTQEPGPEQAALPMPRGGMLPGYYAVISTDIRTGAVARVIMARGSYYMAVSTAGNAVRELYYQAENGDRDAPFIWVQIVRI